MKAVVCPQYGPPDVLQLREVAKPAPQDNEVLIRIEAAIAGPADCAFRKGKPFIVKLFYGLRKPKFPIIGTELAGEIEAIGKAVTRFKPGDQVFGLSVNNFGAYAGYTCLAESDPLVVRSAGMTAEEAAAICDGAPTALTFLRDVAHIQPGHRVLINGASGAVGAYAVQLARHFGAEVTGVCSSANVDRVQALGADQVIDYTQADFTQTGQTYDIIFDAVGKRSFSQCKNALTPQGIYLSTVLTWTIIRHMAWTAMRGGKKAKFATAGLMQNKENLNFLKELFAAGKLQAVIDRCYPLEEIVEAHRYVETGHKKGNVVITLGGSV